MSKLIQQLEVRKTSQEFAIFNKYVEITQETKDFNLGYSKGIEYHIMATFGSRVVLNEEMLTNDPRILDYAIRDTKESIIEAVFGEFRQDIRLVSKYLYDRDIEKALAALRELDRKMFYE